jgi:hypothetical protein
MRILFAAALTALGLSAAPAFAAPVSVSESADPPPFVKGDVIVRIAVTIHPDDEGTLQVPSPFAIVPGTDRVILHVPESEGIFVLEGDRILHHYPLDSGLLELDDLAASGELLAAGRRPDDGRNTAEIAVFDLLTGRDVDHIRSANPHLRVGFEAAHLWRLVVASGRVGVYQPESGGTFPLWERGRGLIPSSEQIAQAVSGIGFAETEARFVPLVDGSVSLRRRSSEVPFVESGNGEFLDGATESAVLMWPPAGTVRSDADGDFLLSRELVVRFVGWAGKRFDFRLESIDRGVEATRLVVSGRPVRIHGTRMYWIFIGPDYLDIRAVDLAELFPAEG